MGCLLKYKVRNKDKSGEIGRLILNIVGTNFFLRRYCLSKGFEWVRE